MGAAACKVSKAPLDNRPKDEKRNITIGVYGLDDAGKTSIVKAIEGDPTEDVISTKSSVVNMVPYALNEKYDHQNKKKSQEQQVRVIDVSGSRKYRENSWSQYYDELHGIIFVIDASKRKRFSENQEVLADLLNNNKLKGKPILIFANKIDHSGTIRSETELRRQLSLESVKAKHKIELCSALPQDNKNKVDESIRRGFSWLLRTIEENYAELNARVTKAKSNQTSKNVSRVDSDENDSDNKYARNRNTMNTMRGGNPHTKITAEKLPSISNPNRNRGKVLSDDDEDDDSDEEDNDDDDVVKSSAMNGYNKKTQVQNGKSNSIKPKKSDNKEPTTFRSSYEPFPEENPWSVTSPLKTAKSDDALSRFNTKSLTLNDSKRREISPLVYDSKSYTTGTLPKRYKNSDDEEDYYGQQKSKLTNRSDYLSSSTNNRFSSNTKKPSSELYDDDYDTYNKVSDRSKTTTVQKKTLNRRDALDNDDDDEDEDDRRNNYSKSSTTLTNARANKSYDYDDNKSYQRSSARANMNSEYRDATSKSLNRSKRDSDDDDDVDDGDNKNTNYYKNYSTPKQSSRPTYDDDNPRWPPTKTTTDSKFTNDNYPTSSWKSPSRSKFDDNHYSSSSKPSAKSTYDDDDRPYSSSKGVLSSKFEDDDYPSSSKKLNDSSSNNANRTYNKGPINSSRSPYNNGDDDFFTSNRNSNNMNRSRRTTGYDS